ncbi:hypothetical protein ACPA9J_04285 [Pseudomonas aeruginosa]
MNFENSVSPGVSAFVAKMRVRAAQSPGAILPGHGHPASLAPGVSTRPAVAWSIAAWRRRSKRTLRAVAARCAADAFSCPTLRTRSLPWTNHQVGLLRAA